MCWLKPLVLISYSMLPPSEVKGDFTSALHLGVLGGLGLFLFSLFEIFVYFIF